MSDEILINKIFGLKIIIGSLVACWFERKEKWNITYLKEHLPETNELIEYYADEFMDEVEGYLEEISKKIRKLENKLKEEEKYLSPIAGLCIYADYKDKIEIMKPGPQKGKMKNKCLFLPKYIELYHEKHLRNPEINRMYINIKATLKREKLFQFSYPLRNNCNYGVFFSEVFREIIDKETKSFKIDDEKSFLTFIRLLKEEKEKNSILKLDYHIRHLEYFSNFDGESIALLQFLDDEIFSHHEEINESYQQYCAFYDRMFLEDKNKPIVINYLFHVAFKFQKKGIEYKKTYKNWVGIIGNSNPYHEIFSSKESFLNFFTEFSKALTTLRKNLVESILNLKISDEEVQLKMKNAEKEKIINQITLLIENSKLDEAFKKADQDLIPILIEEEKENLGDILRQYKFSYNLLERGISKGFIKFGEYQNHLNKLGDDFYQDVLLYLSYNIKQQEQMKDFDLIKEYIGKGKNDKAISEFIILAKKYNLNEYVKELTRIKGELSKKQRERRSGLISQSNYDVLFANRTQRVLDLCEEAQEETTYLVQAIEEQAKNLPENAAGEITEAIVILDDDMHPVEYKAPFRQRLQKWIEGNRENFLENLGKGIVRILIRKVGLEPKDFGL